MNFKQLSIFFAFVLLASAEQDCRDNHFGWDISADEISFYDINSWMNCCGTHSAFVSVEDGDIPKFSFVEVENPPTCRCNCFFDWQIASQQPLDLSQTSSIVVELVRRTEFGLHIVFSDTVRVINGASRGRTLIAEDVGSDFNSPVAVSEHPVREVTLPTAVIIEPKITDIDISECGGFKNEDPCRREKLIWNAHDGVLTLIDENAWINCCLEEYTALVISRPDSVELISVLGGEPCKCMCFEDFEYVLNIENAEPFYEFAFIRGNEIIWEGVLGHGAGVIPLDLHGYNCNDDARRADIPVMGVILDSHKQGPCKNGEDVRDAEN